MVFWQGRALTGTTCGDPGAEAGFLFSEFAIIFKFQKFSARSFRCSWGGRFVTLPVKRFVFDFFFFGVYFASSWLWFPDRYKGGSFRALWSVVYFRGRAAGIFWRFTF